MSLISGNNIAELSSYLWLFINGNIKEIDNFRLSALLHETFKNGKYYNANITRGNVDSKDEFIDSEDESIDSEDESISDILLMSDSNLALAPPKAVASAVFILCILWRNAEFADLFGMVVDSIIENFINFLKINATHAERDQLRDIVHTTCGDMLYYICRLCFEKSDMQYAIMYRRTKDHSNTIYTAVKEMFPLNNRLDSKNDNIFANSYQWLLGPMESLISTIIEKLREQNSTSFGCLTTDICEASYAIENLILADSILIELVKHFKILNIVAAINLQIAVMVVEDDHPNTFSDIKRLHEKRHDLRRIVHEFEHLHGLATKNSSKIHSIKNDAPYAASIVHSSSSASSASISSIQSVDAFKEAYAESFNGENKNEQMANAGSAYTINAILRALVKHHNDAPASINSAFIKYKNLKSNTDSDDCAVIKKLAVALNSMLYGHSHSQFDFSIRPNSTLYNYIISMITQLGQHIPSDAAIIYAKLSQCAVLADGFSCHTQQGTALFDVNMHHPDANNMITKIDNSIEYEQSKFLEDILELAYGDEFILFVTSQYCKGVEQSDTDIMVTRVINVVKSGINFDVTKYKSIVLGTRNTILENALLDRELNCNSRYFAYIIFRILEFCHKGHNGYMEESIDNFCNYLLRILAGIVLRDTKFPWLDEENTSEIAKILSYKSHFLKGVYDDMRKISHSLEDFDFDIINYLSDNNQHNLN
jgi:hypothetical protein